MIRLLLKPIAWMVIKGSSTARVIQLMRVDSFITDVEEKSRRINEENNRVKRIDQSVRFKNGYNALRSRYYAGDKKLAKESLIELRQKVRREIKEVGTKEFRHRINYNPDKLSSHERARLEHYISLVRLLVRLRSVQKQL